MSSTVDNSPSPSDANMLQIATSIDQQSQMLGWADAAAWQQQQQQQQRRQPSGSPSSAHTAFDYTPRPPTVPSNGMPSAGLVDHFQHNSHVPDMRYSYPQQPTTSAMAAAAQYYPQPQQPYVPPLLVQHPLPPRPGQQQIAIPYAATQDPTRHYRTDETWLSPQLQRDQQRLSNPSPRACVRCKRLKVRCEDVNGARPCKRCKNANQECVPAQRKQRPRKSEHRVGNASSTTATQPATSSPEASRGSASAELSDDSSDDSGEWEDDPSAVEGSPHPAAEQLSLADPSAPLGWITQLALETGPRRERSTTSNPAHAGEDKKEKGPRVGLSKRYFLPDVQKDSQSPPEILTIMTENEVKEMFKLFMDRINPYMSMFDDKLHTQSYVRSKSQFLLSVICGIAARYYTARPDTYVRAMELVKKEAGDAITSGLKSIEHCQAFILLASYPPPDRKYSDNKNWLYSGVAFRMATDLGLHRPRAIAPEMSELQARESLNATRTWIVCYYLDESMSTHFGRPATIRQGDPVMRAAREWWRKSPYNLQRYDVHLCLFVELLRKFRTFIDEANPESEEAEKDIDYYALSEKFDDEVARFEGEAETLFAENGDRDDPVCQLRERLVSFVTQYARLIVHSTGFQKQVRRPGQEEDVFLNRCMNAAFRVLEIVMREIYSTQQLRYACDGYFWYTSFASAFLLKFLSSEYKDKISEELREKIISHVQELINVLSAKEVAIDASHPPKLFSRFLNGMLSKHVKKAATPAPAVQPPLDVSPTTEFNPATPALTASPTKSMASPLVVDPGLGWEPIGVPGASAFEYDQFGGLSASTEMDEFMKDVSPQELNTGMMILDNPPWWHDASLGLDFSAMATTSNQAMFDQPHYDDAYFHQQ